MAMPVLAVVLAAGAEECESGAARKVCNVYPRVEIEGGLVVGTATAVCDVAPEEHSFELELQYAGPEGSPEGPEWETENRKKSNEIPRPGRDVIVTVRHMCLDGPWRSYVSIVGVGPDGEPFTFSDSKVREVSVNDDC